MVSWHAVDGTHQARSVLHPCDLPRLVSVHAQVRFAANPSHSRDYRETRHV